MTPAACFSYIATISRSPVTNKRKLNNFNLLIASVVFLVPISIFRNNEN